MVMVTYGNRNGNDCNGDVELCVFLAAASIHGAARASGPRKFFKRKVQKVGLGVGGAQLNSVRGCMREIGTPRWQTSSSDSFN